MSKAHIKKQKWKGGNMVYPLPAAMVSCGDETQNNIVTVGWTGTICTNPPMTYISLRKSRYSYEMIKERGYFVINLTTKELVKATDFCGVRSGRDYDKFKEMNLTPVFPDEIKCPMIGESPVSILCKVREIKELGSHDMFIADVLNLYVSEALLDENNKFHLNHADLIAYSHGAYVSLGEPLGTFGYSVRKKPLPHTTKQNQDKNVVSALKQNNKSSAQRGRNEMGEKMRKRKNKNSKFKAKKK